MAQPPKRYDGNRTDKDIPTEDNVNYNPFLIIPEIQTENIQPKIFVLVNSAAMIHQGMVFILK